MTLILNLMSHCLRLASFFPFFSKHQEMKLEFSTFSSLCNQLYTFNFDMEWHKAMSFLCMICTRVCVYIYIYLHMPPVFGFLIKTVKVSVYEVHRKVFSCEIFMLVYICFGQLILSDLNL